MRKNPGNAGSRNGMAKLTREQVEEVKNVYAAGGISMTALGAHFDVSAATVYRAVHGISWSHSYDSDEELFWSKVNRDSGLFCNVTETECWIWTAGTFDDGYGAFWHEGKLWRAHKWSYDWAYDVKTVKGQLFRHSCDRPLCVRYDHLTAGTPAENSTDMVARGRSACGEKNPASKLTNENVLEVRSRHVAGEGKLKLAREFGVSKPTITRLLRGVTWKHV